MASDKPIIAIATGDPAGIGPEISLKAALDPAVRAACRPILVSDADILRAPRRGLRPRRPSCIRSAGSKTPASPAIGSRCSIARDRRGCARLVQRRGRTCVAGVLRHRRESRPVEAGRGRRRRPAERNVDCARRYSVRWPALVRRARNRNARGRRLHDAVLRRHEDIARDAAPERPAGARTRSRVSALARSSTTRSDAPAHGHRHAEDRRQGLNPHAGEGGLFGREEIDVIEPAIDAAAAAGLNVAGPYGPTRCFTWTASMPSSSCCTTRATSPRSCWRSTPQRRSLSARRSCFPPSRMAAPTTSPERASRTRRR